MSVERDYIGLSVEPEAPKSMKNSGLNLKATELRLGLPGSESPERGSGENKNNTMVASLKSFVGSGAKRGFSHAKWGFSTCDHNLYSATTAASNGSKLLPPPNSHLAASVVKEAAAQSPKPVAVLQDKKPREIASSSSSSKAQVVGWPPIRSFRKNTMSSHSLKNEEDSEPRLGLGCLYVKVSMDGAPYLRKVDLKTFSSYTEFLSALEKMFSCFTIGHCGSHNIPGRDGLSESGLMDLLHGSEYVLAYEDKDGDWMLVGDVPWDMFTSSCKRLRIMKSSEAIGLAPRAMVKRKNHN